MVLTLLLWFAVILEKREGYSIMNKKRIILVIAIIAVILVGVSYKILESSKIEYELTQDEKMAEKIDGVTDESNLAFMKNLYDLFEAGNTDEVKNLVQADEFSNITANITEAEPAFYSPESAGAAKSGKGVGIYAIWDLHYVYYGDYVNNMRNGQALWVGTGYGLEGNPEFERIFEGQWVDDKPNGQGQEEWIDPQNAGNRSVTKGTYADGLEDGSMTRESFEDDGSYYIFHYTASNGIVPRLKKIPVHSFDNNSFPIAESESSDGRKLTLTRSEGERWGVIGFTHWVDGSIEE